MIAEELIRRAKPIRLATGFLAWIAFCIAWQMLALHFPKLRTISPEFALFYMSAVCFVIWGAYRMLFRSRTALERISLSLATAAFICVPIYYAAHGWMRPVIIGIGAGFLVAFFIFTRTFRTQIEAAWQ
jgi:exosortase/archaeosortase